jgi:hypothetical protein
MVLLAKFATLPDLCLVSRFIRNRNCLQLFINPQDVCGLISSQEIFHLLQRSEERIVS